MVRIAVIPVGGEAVRLRPLTVETSKAMIRFLNRPLVELSILHLARQGIEEFYFGVRGYHNYRDIYDYFREGSWFAVKYGVNIKIRYMPRVETRGNAEAVLATLEYYDINEPVLVIQGDNIFNLDVKEMYSFHSSKKAFITIALKEETGDLSEFGVAAVDDNMRILKFVEKPKRREEAPSNLVNTGLYLLSEDFKSFFKGELGGKLYSEGRLDFGGDVIPAVIEAGLPVYGYHTKGYWFDVGTPERYLKAVQYLLRHLTAYELEAEEIAPSVFAQGKSEQSKALKEKIAEAIKNGQIKAEGRLLLGRHVQIGDNSYLRDTVIDNYVIIGDNSVIEDSVVMDRSYIGRGVVIRRSIIGRHVQIGDGAVIEDAVVADNVIVGDGAHLRRVKVWPHKTVERGVRLEGFSLI
ncbi:nucleotidyltransferase family protein [Pyrobaculum aerophilum]|mgnify:CR=1 FL=1|uniref:Glucose-1-phosphate adenylyltransferase n=2 Tax=Pyrobaculum aerophilum TaxID=13773 RepID=Q8ZT55_PYRAE|nr:MULTISPECIES: NDP-sugar synthase [Pyrobaculum]AAL64908.1 glucose-1-phosphate adenylyltransferase [Pyrobaculum aerophilum str. IM2]MCX8135428.1 NDP-sugar synthase [Pyrobaculum aerophilum]HII47479.1 NDP-sugar synthase [Pyrobaculum aerophilum]